MHTPKRQCGELDCSVTIELLADSGETRKSQLYRSAGLTLMRNEFNDIYLQLTTANSMTNLKYPIEENITIHKRFAKDGCAAIKIGKKNTQLLLANCPPDRLMMFLRCLSTKLELQKSRKRVSMKARLKSDAKRTFDLISPLSLKEVEQVREKQADLALKEQNVPKKLDSRGLKRKLDSQNLVPVKKPAVTKIPTVLTIEQKQVLEAVMSGKNVFFTGSAGTGKSFLLKRILGALPPNHTFATASTGIAACHIGGITLHSFAGIGSGKGSLEQCIQLAQRPGVIQQWRKCHHLIIDEISMVDGEFFDKLECIARVVKKNDSPFGGIQLILCGDFLQLPPVTKGGMKKNFCFQSEAWNSCIDISLELRAVKRQSDPAFINILNHIRIGRCPPEMVLKLQETSKHRIGRNGVQATRLCTHREDVDELNILHLRKLEGDSRIFTATDSDPNLAAHMDKLCPVVQSLTLKVGAQVMLAKNLDVQQGLVNGARGVVTGFGPSPEGLPKVKFISGIEQLMKYERWTCRAGAGVLLTRKQIPLKLAWAISIHKSQGMTLDCVELSLSRVFESGQAYVALSRASCLQGLRVLDFDGTCVQANPNVLRFYQRLRRNRNVPQKQLRDYMFDDNKENIPP